MLGEKMVQQEVKKKTRLYGTVAVLSAIVLVALIFVFGSPPSLTPLVNPPLVSGMKPFADETALRNYLVANTRGTSNYIGGPLDSTYFARSGDIAPMPTPAPSLASPGAESASQSDSYSTTNIQVAGVDEADIVKSDGNYLYVAPSRPTNEQNYVYILKAGPQDPRVIARIALENNTYLAGIYISQDSSKLIVVGSQYGDYIYLGEPVYAGGNGEISIYQYFENNVKTFVNVYDVSDKVHPLLARNVTLSGSYFNSRMIGDYVYAVISQPAYVLENVLPLPRVYADTEVSEIAPSKIYYSDTANYSDVANNYFTYTTFISLNVKDSGQELTNMTVLMGRASTMYVSLSNIYLTYPTWSEGGEYTSIYRISVDKNVIASETAEGSVPGYVLNQYSMDEYNGNFRLATTSWKDTTRNAVYVLNSNLTTVGEVKLENAEVRETIQSVRFMDDKAYIVTFQQKDPFFVLDMSNPTAPRVAGKLEIPGYSSYLHPYDENHVIGLGKENSTVKLSLFDVSNVNEPTEIAKYIVEADYAESQALHDPHAFLFDKDKQLLVLPISLTQYGVVDQSGREPIYSWATTAGFWQGAYVFKLTTSGFTLRGTITHAENATSYGIDYNQSVERALYIGNTLYTVSNAKVQLNSLDSLALIAEVDLS
jgi:inhibitor of cysteine peptidase